MKDDMIIHHINYKEIHGYDKKYDTSGMRALYRKTYRKELADKQRIYTQKTKNEGV